MFNEDERRERVQGCCPNRDERATHTDFMRRSK
jgi:hypothetical protein